MTELPITMASLEIDDNQAPPCIEAAEGQRTESFSDRVCQVLRKEVPDTFQSYESSKRRCSLRPKKLNISQETDNERSYFMSKKIHPLRVKTLATIYEEPKVNKRGVITHTGQSKLRKINFDIISKEKIRRRKAKLKKVLSHRIPKKGRLSVEEFMPILHRLMGSSPNGSDRKVDRDVSNFIGKM